MIIIPAIDLKEGQCVRLKQGDMHQATVFSTNPVEMAEFWCNEGARRLHLVDLDGAFEGKPKNKAWIEAIVTTLDQHHVPIQVGGGVRDLETIEAYLTLGVRWVIIGTQAVRDPDFVAKACRAFPDSIMVGLDAKAGKIATQGWAESSQLDVLGFAKRFADSGVSALIFTDIARDGMMSGVNSSLTAEVAKASGVSVIASGGVANLQDIESLLKLRSVGVAGAIVGRALYEHQLDLKSAQALADRG
jgi:phosphoribosylformimino-5-aminoimidazole carboxamide ribotide isomerase